MHSFILWNKYIYTLFLAIRVFFSSFSFSINIFLLCFFLNDKIFLYIFSFISFFMAGMILRNYTSLKVYKCWRILPILKTTTIKWLAIFFKKYFNFQGFFIVYIIIWRFSRWKNFTPSKLGETGLQKMQNDESFLGEIHGKISLWAKICP